MIVSLRGIVTDIRLDHAVIECAGVGYKVLASPGTLAQLVRGEEAYVLVTMIVREDSQTLYGFIHTETREMFHLLQSVSGLGPKLALAALSVYDTGVLSHAIANQDVKTLQKIPGVGKRMAERMIVDLKDKVAAYTATAEPLESNQASLGNTQGNLIAMTVVEALVGLGFSEKVAAPVVTGVVENNPDMQTSALLRMSLSLLGQQSK